MKSLYLIASLLIFGISYSQKKDTIYIDFDGKKVNRLQFEGLDQSNMRIVIHDFTFPIKKIAFSKKNIGNLDSIQASQLNMYLQKIIGPNFDKSKRTFIHLYKNNDKQIKHDSQNQKYWAYIKNSQDKYQSFLFGEKNSDIETDSKNHIYVDDYGLIEKLFFKKTEYNINHLVIKPSGEIYVFYGTANILYILDASID